VKFDPVSTGRSDDLNDRVSMNNWRGSKNSDSGSDSEAINNNKGEGKDSQLQDSISKSESLKRFLSSRE
jgi:hypothetical protein